MHPEEMERQAGGPLRGAVTICCILSLMTFVIGVYFVAATPRRAVTHKGADKTKPVDWDALATCLSNDGDRNRCLGNHVGERASCGFDNDSLWCARNLSNGVLHVTILPLP